MTQESYVSFEIAKLLKEKGFDWDCTSHFDSYHIECPNTPMNSNSTKYWVSRPTHQMACAWIRDKGYHIAVLFNSKFRTWERIIQASTGIKWSLGGFSSHDKAVEEGIKYALEVLI